MSKLDIKAFRHTFATALLEGGEENTQVARCLGHAEATVTRRVYAHYFKRPEGSPVITSFADAIFKTARGGKEKAGEASATAG